MSVVALDTMRPKTLRKRYKNHDFTLTYNKETQRWLWEVTYVQVTKYGEDAATQNAALRAAEKHIDKMLSIKQRAAYD